MASDTRNVKLGVCSITFDGVDLGYTKGGVEIEVKTETKKVMVDQFGQSEINEYVMGRSCMAKIPLAETTLENMSRIMPGSTLIGSGGAKASATITFVTAPPINNDKITLNGVDFTFKTAPLANSNDINVAGATTVALAASLLAAAINNSIDPLVSAITATVVAGVITLTADEQGVAGNAITLAKTWATPANLTTTSFLGGLDATKKKVVVPNGIGISLLSIAKKLVLHPIALPAAQRNEDFTIPLAMTAGDMQYAFKLDAERIFNCTFTAYPDPVTKTLFVVGDETAV